MHRVFRHVLVLTIAFALVASAASWRQCMALQLATAGAASTEHGSLATKRHADAASHSDHYHHAMHTQHHVDDTGPPSADDHGCTKCCAMCTVANALPLAANAAVIFTFSSRLFSRDHELWTANTVAVDPGIPKRIV